MSRQRYVQDSFWTDPYIEKLSPDYKLAFLYLLTNPLANVAGVYEVRSKRMAYETGYDEQIIENILKKFSDDNKIIRSGDWIIMVNHMKHQSLGNSTAEGINRVIKEAPLEIQELFEEKTFTNSKDIEYNVLSLKEFNRPPIGPLQAPPNGTYSEVKLSIVKLSNKGEFQNIKISDDEYRKLIEKLGEVRTNELIEELSGYIASKGKKYSSHYATILNWARMKNQKQENRGKSYSIIN